jgi:hypothetical protein
MKKILMIVTLLVGTNAIASPISFENGSGGRVLITLARGKVYTEKLIDALVNSNKVEEINTGYGEPKTFYRGKNFYLSLQKNRATLAFLNVLGSKFLNFNGNNLSMVDSSGVTKAFRDALLESTSKSVTQYSPNNPLFPNGRKDMVHVMEYDSFRGSYISCSDNNAFGKNGEYVTCSFNLLDQ